MKPDTFNLQNRGTIGKSVGKLRVNDMMSDFLVCHAHDHVLYFRYFLNNSISSTEISSCTFPSFLVNVGAVSWTYFDDNFKNINKLLVFLLIFLTGITRSDF